MSANEAIRRLFAYYRSEMFQEAFRLRNGKGGANAVAYRQHLVDQMNAHYKTAGVAPSADDLARQALFLDGDMDIAELAALAADYGVAGLPEIPE